MFPLYPCSFTIFYYITPVSIAQSGKGQGFSGKIVCKQFYEKAGFFLTFAKIEYELFCLSGGNAMKCPNCGHWNRASLPRCFQCGTPLTQPEPEKPLQEEPSAPSAGKTYIRYTEDGRSTASMDDRDALAQDMQSLQQRKQKGAIEQQRLRQRSAQQGIAPTGRNVQTLSGRPNYPQYPKNTVIREEEEIQGNIRADAIPVTSSRSSSYAEQETLDFTHAPVYAAPTVRRVKRNAKNFGLRRYTRLFAALLLVVGLGFGVFMLNEYTGFPFGKKVDDSLQAKAIITNTILNDMPAHMIKIPAEEGATIYIKELHKSFTVTGGYATIEVEDYTWYEALEIAVEEAEDDKKDEAQKRLDELLKAEFITATITPYIKTNANEQKQMDIITFDVDIPLSPLTLVSPDTGYAEVSKFLYEIQFEVASNSSVIINDQDLSDLVNTNNGALSYQAPVTATGANTFTITTRAPHCRPTTATVTLYRAPQVIPLDMQADIQSRYSPNLVDDTSQPPDANGKYPQKEDPMVVRCTTISTAHIEILSDYRNLDLSTLETDGKFSFEPVFTKIGTNTITIIASDPDHPETPPSIVQHDVYYVPIASIYTRKAWDMCDDYNDFLNNAETRIAKSQIYLCEGTITSILSTKPQLAIMTLDDDPTRTVLLENISNDTYMLNQRYRVFGDAYGMYNGMPRLMGRYTYPPLD